MSTTEIVGEQTYVSMLYGQLDRLRDRAAGRLAEVLAAPGGTDQAMSERDTFAADLSRRIVQIDAAEHGLCFGRLDLGGGDRRYVGRLGIVDDDGDYEQLLIDWRAPAARPFYVATAVAPDGVRRRRHIRTRLRQVVAVDDEVLDRHSPDAARRRRPGRRGRAAGRAGGQPHRSDGRHRGDHPGRAGPGHPQPARRRAGRAGRRRHRQDRGRPAPRGLPALHPPRAAGPPRRPGRRAERDLPALHRPGAAVARRDRGGAGRRRRARSPG